MNPFIYGEEVTGAHFTDRENEIKTFIRDAESNERIFLISPRRYGKTSLVVKLLEILKRKKRLISRIDLYKVTSLEVLANFYTSSVISSIESKPEKWIRILRQLLPSLSPTLTFTPEGAELSLNLRRTEGNIEQTLDELFNLPEKIAKRSNKKAVIFFDEFQEIRKINGDKIEKLLRANIQKHHNVSYIFAGSNKRMLYEMAESRDSAFYKMGKIVRLSKIPRNIFQEFVISKFLKSKIVIKEDTMDKLFQITENVPYNVQYLCHQIWDKYCDVKTKITVKEVDEVVSDIIYNQSPLYTGMWDRLTLHQQAVLKAIAIGGGSGIFSNYFIGRFNLGSAASVQTSVNSLILNEFLDKEENLFSFTDVFFKEWIIRRIV
ncbi:MAG: ATP-binding protein [Elusimicrobiota bacterium]